MRKTITALSLLLIASFPIIAGEVQMPPVPVPPPCTENCPATATATTTTTVSIPDEALITLIGVLASMIRG